MPEWIESGDPRSPIYIVGEAPGDVEIAQRRPFVGPSGYELDRMLTEAGWPSSTRFFKTNICHVQPPEYRDKNGRLIKNDIDQFFLSRKASLGSSPVDGRYPSEPIRRGLERLGNHLAQHRPRLIIALGGSALWGLTGAEGITKWRGSVLEGRNGLKVLPTLHPAAILTHSFNFRSIAVQDLRRALRESAFPEIKRPQWQHVVSPSLDDIHDWLLPRIHSGTPLACDIEGWGVVDTIGFAASATEALCVPFVRGAGSTLQSYWPEAEEESVLAIVLEALRRCPLVFHNATFDCQVISRRLGVMPRLDDDTMLMQHVLFPGLLGGKIDPTTGRVDKKGSSLSLAFLASMYCENYRYWKDDSKVRDETVDDETDWRYNCEDCCRTFEVATVLRSALAGAKLWDNYRRMLKLYAPIFTMMFAGVALDQRRVKAMAAESAATEETESAWIETALGFCLNPASHPQMHSLFYDDLACEIVKDRKTKKPTLDDAALDLTARRKPLLLPLIRKIQNIRSMRTNESHFLRPFAAAGARLRTQLNVTGAETFRFSSSETAFGEGTNMQNLTRPTDE